MELKLIRIVVNRESDRVENGVKYVDADITIVCNLVGVNNTQEIAISTTVTSLNSDRGDDMDLQRQAECESLINNF
jgi:hypothetical protein